MAEEKDKFMFLCSHNSCRSQMGEVLMRKHGADIFDVYSSGLYPAEIHPLTLKVLEEKGLDTGSLKSEAAKDYLGRMDFRYVVIVCAKADRECPHSWPNVFHREFWPFEDPAAFEGSEEEKLAKFREVRDALEERIIVFLDGFRKNQLE